MRCHLALALSLTLVPTIAAEELTPARRGYKALTERPFTAAMWRTTAYDNAWRRWTPAPKERPKDYAQAFMDYYGLHPAPYKSRFPMGVRDGENFLGKGLTGDCMLCHAGSILGKSYIGMPNSSLDIQALFDDLGSGGTPFPFSNVRGTSEAGSFAAYLLQFRDPELNIRIPKLDLEMRQNLCEDVPAWWLLRKKQTMYHTGTAHARSVRSLMQFMLSPTTTRDDFDRDEAAFRDIQAYLLSLEPPRYPFPINKELAAGGERIFVKTCAKCHGTYGDKWTYPNKIVPLDIVGTDPTRFFGFSPKVGEHYNKSWFAREKRPDGKEGYPSLAPEGYQAPPLDGVWATAPYFHNGSVPTLYDVLNSKTRPKIYTRSYRTGAEDYDAVKVGWNVQVLEGGPDPRLPGHERRKVYDTTQPGRGNQGHAFGDDLSDDERRAVIEYLKTL
jgi:mono/diheme cytochrome c family protein